MKVYIIILIVIMSVLGIYWYVSYMQPTDDQLPKQQSTPQQQTEFDTVRPEHDSTFSIGTKYGDQLTVPDFRETGTLLGSDTYVLDDSGLPDNDLYEIVYFASYDFFQVSLEQKPLALARSQAERALAQLLRVSPDILCDLDLSVKTRLEVDLTYAGTELGLPSCPGSLSLENI